MEYRHELEFFEESAALQQQAQEFFRVLNPNMRYQVIQHVYYEKIHRMWMFEKAEQQEIMYIAQRMQARLSVNEEQIITQGDIAHHVFFILKGKVHVSLTEINIVVPNRVKILKKASSTLKNRLNALRNKKKKLKGLANRGTANEEADAAADATPQSFMPSLNGAKDGAGLQQLLKLSMMPMLKLAKLNSNQQPKS